LGLEIKLERALTWLERENAARSIVERVLYSVLLIKAVALAVREVPEMNGFWVNDGFQASAAVHLGMAISLRGGGLVAPALHDADRKSLADLMRELRDLVARTRAGSLRSSELSDPTITLTNLGEQGVDSVFGIIFPPQVALVGFGRISERRSIQVSLSADHRASDGHRGALFLAAIDRRLQAPETL
jgi:pyruvate dehydrogenase E2 component (dihydrolipoamide acetyltransferase)